MPSGDENRRRIDGRPVTQRRREQMARYHQQWVEKNRAHVNNYSRLWMRLHRHQPFPVFDEVIEMLVPSDPRPAPTAPAGWS
jgi:hypothetical protein